jgi:hypothetical protein
MFESSSSNQPTVIAGKTCGIPIEATPKARVVFNALEAQADKNYWAHMIVNGIKALCSGQLSVNNVFIKEQGYRGAMGSEFYVVLPGCTATMEKLSSGRYKLLYMKADENYFKSQVDGVKPGLYNVSKHSDEWEAEFISNGQIKSEKDRVVAISDSGYANPSDAANEIENFITKSPVSGGSFTLASNGYDMHYTAGNERIGGLRNLKQALAAQTDKGLHESAILLARTMAQSKDIKGVRWIAERGGSGVLTQAMRILADSGVKLEKHTIFLSNPRTQKHQIVELAKKIGFKMDRDIAQSNPLNPSELAGGLFFGVGGYYTSAKRLMHDDSYTKLNFVGDVSKETLNLKGAGGTALAVGAALGITTGVGVPAVAVFAGAIGATMGLGSKLAETFVPRIYHKISSKF